MTGAGRDADAANAEQGPLAMLIELLLAEKVGFNVSSAVAGHSNDDTVTAVKDLAKAAT